MTRESDERMCAGREFQLLGEDTQKAREAKDDLTQVRVPFLKLKRKVSINHLECIKTHHFDKKYKKNFLGGGTAPPQTLYPVGTFGARPPVPVSDGLDTRSCKILDPPLF